MKRFIYLLLMLPLLGLVSACHDDKDLPDVSLSLDYSGGTQQDGAIYVVQGDTLTINALRAIPAEGTKAATLTNVVYFWDGMPQTPPIDPNQPIQFNTAEMEVGNHTLGANATVLQVDKEIGFAVTQFPVVIVASDSDQPGEGDSGTITPDTRITDNDN